MSILAVLEQRGGEWNRMSFETLAAAQQFAKELGATGRGRRARPGHRRAGGEAGRRSSWRKSTRVEHDLLKDYTPDAYYVGAAAVDRHR